MLNGDNFGPVTLFRVYPDGVDTFSMPQQERTDPAMRDQLRAHNDYNRRIFERVQHEALQGRGVVISLTDCYRETDYGEPIVALKSYILSPFSEERTSTRCSNRSGRRAARSRPSRSAADARRCTSQRGERRRPAAAGSMLRMAAIFQAPPSFTSSHDAHIRRVAPSVCAIS